MNKKRIVFVTNNFSPYSGGLVSSITAIAEQLRVMGHEVIIITLDFLANEHNDPEYVIRIPSWIRFMHRGNHMALPKNAAQHIRKVLQEFKPGVVHVHHPFLLGPIAVNQAHKLGIPVVFTYHTMYQDYAHYVPFPKFITKYIIRYKVKKFCKSVDMIVAPSSAVAEQLQSWKIPTPHTVIPSPIAQLFTHSSSSVKSLGNTVNVLIVSRFTKEKNLRFIIDLVGQLEKPFIVTMVGYGSCYEQLKKYAQNTLKLSSDRVKFVYKPSKQEVLQSYQDAHVFLFSSTTDTQGIVLAEAMSQGLPVIALNGPGQRDIIMQDVNGYIVNSQEEMLVYINRMGHSAVHYQQLSAGAFDTAQRYYPKYITQKLLLLYDELLAKSL